jgi:predicted site-specific integrase-resolvase
MGMRYETAWRWFYDDIIQGWRIGPCTIIITDDQEEGASVKLHRTVIYARVSSAEKKTNLDSRAEWRVVYAAARGYQVAKVVREVGLGGNGSRPRLLASQENQCITLIVVEHKDRLTRFEFC